MNSLSQAARVHLEQIQIDIQNLHRVIAYFVPLLTKYGVPVEEISSNLGMTVEEIERIINGQNKVTQA